MYLYQIKATERLCDELLIWLSFHPWCQNLGTMLRECPVVLYLVLDKSKVRLWVTSTHKSNQSCDSKDTHGTLKCQLVHTVCYLKEAQISPF